MARALRIEYDGAFYHVMNRGRGRQKIFHNTSYYSAFLETLQEAHQRFKVLTHAYCLMGNHYHLLLETPDGNLSRVMRHINGVYTQRYNRLIKTDGPLFRGRYKAIVVDADSYLLQLSRYIHRNPIEAKKPLVRNLEDYKWSSYPAYLGLERPASWLTMEEVFAVNAHQQKNSNYRNYVEQEIDEDISEFYSKKSLPSILGDKCFKETLLDGRPRFSRPPLRKEINKKIPIEEIIHAVAKVFLVDTRSLYYTEKLGRQPENFPRKFAMYCCQNISGYKLEEIKQALSLKHVGSVSRAVYDVKSRTPKKQVQRKFDAVLKILDAKQ